MSPTITSISLVHLSVYIYLVYIELYITSFLFLIVPPVVTTDVSGIIYRLSDAMVTLVFYIINDSPPVTTSDITWIVQYTNNITTDITGITGLTSINSWMNLYNIYHVCSEVTSLLVYYMTMYVVRSPLY